MMSYSCVPQLPELQHIHLARRGWRAPLMPVPSVSLCFALPPGLPNLVLQTHFAASLIAEQRLATLILSHSSSFGQQIASRLHARGLLSQQFLLDVHENRLNWRSPRLKLEGAREFFQRHMHKAPEAIVIDAGLLPRGTTDGMVEAAHNEIRNQFPGAAVIMIFVETKERGKNAFNRIPEALWVLPTLFLAAPIDTEPDDSAGTFALMRLKSYEHVSNSGIMFRISRFYFALQTVFDLEFGPLIHGDPLKLVRKAESGALAPYLQQGIDLAIELLSRNGPMTREELLTEGEVHHRSVPSTTMSASLTEARKRLLVDRRNCAGTCLWKLPEQSFPNNSRTSSKFANAKAFEQPQVPYGASSVGKAPAARSAYSGATSPSGLTGNTAANSNTGVDTPEQPISMLEMIRRARPNLIEKDIP